MTNEEAIEIITLMRDMARDSVSTNTSNADALDMAIRALKNEQSEQNVGMCQQNVGEMSEKQTDGDLISRDYTIQQIQKAKESNYNFNYDTLIDFIKVLPSTEKADGDLISRTELLNTIWRKEYGIDYDGVNLLNIRHIDIIEQMPSAEKTAEWVAYTEECGRLYQCSNCCYLYEEETKYCPNCGRFMRKGVE